MNPFLRKILGAARLTRHGKLADATAEIQRALAQAGAHTGGRPTRTAAATVVAPEPGDAPVVIDDADVVEMPGPAPHATPRAAATVDDVALEEPRPKIREPGGRFLESSFTAAAGTRTFKLFVPGGFDGDTLPLVVMLHGCTQDPDDFAAGTRMNLLAQEQGFIVLYPAQAPRSNAHKCWNWFSPRDQRRGRGEPALLAGMTRHILQTHSVDPDRVYVAGLSAGGAMAAILAREYPDLFAAAAVHSGVAPGTAHDVSSAFSVMKSGPGAAARPAKNGAPLIVFHGDADATVVPANGDAVIGSVVGSDGAAVGTTTEVAAASGRRAFRRIVWHPADATGDAPSVAEQWVVRGAAHAWSGGSDAGSYTDPAGPDASREMLRFFREHPRRLAG